MPSRDEYKAVAFVNLYSVKRGAAGQSVKGSRGSNAGARRDSPPAPFFGSLIPSSLDFSIFLLASHLPLVHFQLLNHTLATLDARFRRRDALHGGRRLGSNLRHLEQLVVLEG